MRLPSRNVVFRKVLNFIKYGNHGLLRLLQLVSMADTLLTRHAIFPGEECVTNKRNLGESSKFAQMFYLTAAIRIHCVLSLLFAF